MDRATLSANLDLTRLAQHPEAAVAVRALVTPIQLALGDDLVAVWFDGSVALGDFDPVRSDIDLVVVARDFQSRERTSGIRAAHVDSVLASSRWGDEIETIYIEPAALNSAAAGAEMSHCYVERGTGGAICSGPLDRGWVVHLRVLHEHGFSITGPAPGGLIEAVTDDELRAVAGWSAERWLNSYHENPAALDRVGARIFAALTMCRSLYTLETGQIVSKMTAAYWALGAVPPGLAPVVEGAIAWHKEDTGSEGTTRDGVLALIEWTQAMSRTWAAK